MLVSLKVIYCVLGLCSLILSWNLYRRDKNIASIITLVASIMFFIQFGITELSENDDRNCIEIKKKLNEEVVSIDEYMKVNPTSIDSADDRLLFHLKDQLNTWVQKDCDELLIKEQDINVLIAQVKSKLNSND